MMSAYAATHTLLWGRAGWSPPGVDLGRAGFGLPVLRHSWGQTLSGFPSVLDFVVTCARHRWRIACCLR